LNEQGSRNELIQMIDQAVISKNCSKAFLQSIHARFLHSMRGVDKARAHAKHTKEAIRRMNHAEVSYIDATQDPELQQWLPKMKDVINSVSTNGGLQRVWLDKNT
jgi:GH25 family lysozyme M1 (1,4-beta-N-acetylmuramidase)